jgi:hypothetical protein
VLAALESAARDFAAAAGRGELRAVVVESASPKYFVVGANLEALKLIDKDTIAAWVERGHRVFGALADIPVPVVAAVRGYCLGGGLELAMACDFIAASNGARFGLPEAGSASCPAGAAFPASPSAWAFPGEGAPGHRPDDGRRRSRAVGPGCVFRHRRRTGRLSGTDPGIDPEEFRPCRLPDQADPQRRIRPPRPVLLDEATASTVCLSSGDTARRLEDFFKSREKK